MDDGGSAEAGSRTKWWEPGRADWQVAALFMAGASCFILGAVPWYAAAVGATGDGITYFVGSIAFAISAIGAYTIPSTGDLASLELANLGTFVGGVCFFVGALLLIPQEQPD